ncbi:MAG: hydroxymethylglutaryl-CoA lyase [Flavobacteriales bacterium]|nr:hydroxymethylglutaryl-CoA lyase [Flavobacteriales bacterium]MBK6945243.1 hydroxymethylglutaryl-CoA lyase [Flavobacteriales bacterium]MBK7239592.1 hydroxymethylglutaryl-CoA lyase [Flavobacteriales bacterium]MBK7296141.1 hydroxymethylglutaryl-CoA lyase [Flavobacteriales bacterium]MBP9137823.1 hydroxymethylglutaryl-CoA lyase [Flavobacteriales bacterium]
MEKVKLIECPRDAMQGIHEFIPTDVKVDYLNGLLKVGFDTIDIGSFVSPKAIPQMADTAEVLERVDLENSKSKLLVIVANERGAEDAAKQERVNYLGYPFSISETFQQRNTNTSIEGSWVRTAAIAEIARKANKELIVYISMAFGNPYGDQWDAEIAIHWTDRLVNELGVRIIALSDTVGIASPDAIHAMFTSLIPELPLVEFGAHLHARLDNWKPKVDAAWNAGCRRFDGALKGYGGCPMADDDLVGNLAMELFVGDLESRGVITGLDLDLLARSVEKAGRVFPA